MSSLPGMYEGVPPGCCFTLRGVEGGEVKHDPCEQRCPRAVHTELVRQLPITPQTHYANPVDLPLLENPTSTPSKLGPGRAADRCSDKAELSAECLALVLPPEPPVRVYEAEACGHG